MTFSYAVKSEIMSKYEAENSHCTMQEILSIINNCGQINHKYGKAYLYISTDMLFVAQKIAGLLKKEYNIEVSVRNNNKKSTYTIFVSGIEKIDCEVVRNCCKVRYIKLSFLTNGSISNPEKNYHLEFINDTEGKASFLADILNSYGFNAKIIQRKNHYITYIKEGEIIVDLLNLMGAHGALMDFENVRIMKGISGKTNARVNLETANLNKTVEAGLKQEDDILYIWETKGKDFLPLLLQKTALLRLEYTDASLKELGEMLSVSKSCVNHRLRKISEIAQKLREGV